MGHQVTNQHPTVHLRACTVLFGACLAEISSFNFRFFEKYFPPRTVMNRLDTADCLPPANAAAARAQSRAKISLLTRFTPEL